MTNVKRLKILIVDYSGDQNFKNLIRCCFSLIYFSCFLPFFLKLDNATRVSLNTYTSYPPCSNRFLKVKVISGSSIFFGSQPQDIYYSTISPFSFYSIMNILQTQIGQLCFQGFVIIHM
jgi:hypothetical protein